ncbi:MAG: DegT/DnrJ/EryC1/StrS family aminotransferase, partial [Patescibacteria group bacterium]|nr:DegT/DnrJ/EryC1/StrS family aminotransferase [Patescibacteria group bacterium]
IEDCAHALGSLYKGRQLGTFGDFTIYSFSKWFFCFALGGVRTKFGDFSSFADKLIKETPWGATFIKDSIKFLSEEGLFSSNRIFKKYASLLMNMSYSLYGDALKPGFLAERLLLAKIEPEINLRQKRYQYFLEKMKGLGICDHLEKDGITPYVIPIYCPESRNEKILKTLKDMNIEIGLYHFDINRNMLAPNFVPVIWVPCHSGISDELFFETIDLIAKIIKE